MKHRSARQSLPPEVWGRSDGGLFEVEAPAAATAHRAARIDVITKPHLVAKYQRTIEHAGAIIVHGHIERQERVVNVVTERMEPLPLAGTRHQVLRHAAHSW